jgi:hypothetical protein
MKHFPELTPMPNLKEGLLKGCAPETVGAHVQNLQQGLDAELPGEIIKQGHLSDKLSADESMHV